MKNAKVVVVVEEEKKNPKKETNKREEVYRRESGVCVNKGCKEDGDSVWIVLLGEGKK